MQTIKRYSPVYKQEIVKKLVLRGSKTISQFCSEHNLVISTVTRWQTEYGSVPGMKSKKNKSKLSPESILKIIAETYSLNEEELGIYLRTNGLHTHQLEEWRQTILSSMNQPKVNLNKKDERDFKIKDLERNLRKKDAALAEVSALLILQKKANLLWPSPAEDEE